MSFADRIAAADRAAQKHLGGVSVTYAPQVGAPVEVTGMFDANYVLQQPDRSGVENVGPAVFLRLEDLPVHPDDDEPILTIEGQTYKVRERRPDGEQGGGILLLLHIYEAAS